VKLIRKLSALILTAVLLASAQDAFATHNRAGEIIYEHVSGFTYKVTIITVTKASAYADRPYLKIYWGDEPSDVLETELDSLERVVENFLPGVDAKRNEYIGFHTYAGPGIFTLVVEDPNRNAGVINIPQSVWQVFSIRTVLVISPITGHNNSVVLLNPPIQQACFMQPWIHNPAAFDPDGDELVYSLTPCTGLESEPIAGWQLPDVSTDTWPNDVFSINSETGDVTWQVPPWPGEFNIAILIEEYRNGVFVGSVVRDMQITVVLCSNQPPVINPLPDYCVEAGENLNIDVDWFDPDNNQITAAAFGGPLTQVDNQATFNVVNGMFNWNPECEEVRPEPYSVTFTATDNGYVNLTAMETVQITVVAPRVENPEAISQGTAILLNWDIHPCAPIFNEQTAQNVTYKIYRREGLFGFEPTECELGVPDYTGYELVGESEGLNNTTYLDEEVSFGGIYCYMIVTCFPNGAISYASEEFCAQVTKEAPVMTKVSVGVTDIQLGVDTIWWSPPTELDLEVYPGPYQYRLYHRQGAGIPNDLIYQSSISPTLDFADTTFVHNAINTDEFQHAYRVELFSDGTLVFSSSRATSVYLQLTPLDNAMQLDMEFSVPWSNTSFSIYRRDPGQTDFVFIAETGNLTYTDSGLQNNEEYCYYVVSSGSYGTPSVPDPIINYSQQICAQPYDQTPPCPPVLTQLASCADGFNEFIWNNPNNSCADDVTAYNIYYAPVEGQPLTLYATIDLAQDTTFQFTGEEPVFSLAGCFAVTALDSLNLWPDGNFYQNESAFSNIICVDNCPLYYLPNIFTPNGDGLNDLFVPFEYRHVQDIDLKVFNRWGTLVFETADPAISWNGVSSESGQMVADGPYYYVIQVNTVRLSGIVPERFSGTIQLQDGRTPSNSN
jgi:gliding motility-associated-like protein